MAARDRVASPLPRAAGRARAPASPSVAADGLPLRELTGWEEEYLERHQHEANTARTCNEVLARCCVPPGVEPDADIRGRVRGLLVAERDRELVRLRRLSLGPAVEARIDCPECGETNDATFSLDDLDLDLDPSLPGQRVGLPVEGEQLTLTLPTAGDQEELLDTDLDSPAERRTWLLGRCLRTSDGTQLGHAAARALPVRRRAALEHAIDDQLPALDLEMAVSCAHCGAEFAAPFDVGVFFFRNDREGGKPAPRGAPDRARLPLVRAAGLGPAAAASSGIPLAARSGRGRRPVRGPHRERSPRAGSDMTRSNASL
jgi:hypothetical protein